MIKYIKTFSFLFIGLYTWHLRAQPCGQINATNVKIVVTPVKTTYCVGASLTFNVSSTGPGFTLVISSLSWSFSGTAASTTGAAGTNVYKVNNITVGGIVTVTGNIIISGITCPFTRTFNVNLSTLAANAGPDRAMTPDLSPLQIGGFPTASGGTTPYTYLWSPNTNISSINAPIPSVNPTSNITYNVSVTDANACTRNDNMKVFITTTYGELKRSLDGGYYQVTNGKLFFTYTGEYNDATTLKYKIYDDQRFLRVNYTVPPAPALTLNRGDNRYLLTLTTLGFTTTDNGKYFILEVTNEKNEISLLKFKYAQ